jgi:hypothetical protein
MLYIYFNFLSLSLYHLSLYSVCNVENNSNELQRWVHIWWYTGMNTRMIVKTNWKLHFSISIVDNCSTEKQSMTNLHTHTHTHMFSDFYEIQLTIENLFTVEIVLLFVHLRIVVKDFIRKVIWRNIRIHIQVSLKQGC